MLEFSLRQPKYGYVICVELPNLTQVQCQLNRSFQLEMSHLSMLICSYSASPLPAWVFLHSHKIWCCSPFQLPHDGGFLQSLQQIDRAGLTRGLFEQRECRTLQPLRLQIAGLSPIDVGTSGDPQIKRSWWHQGAMELHFYFFSSIDLWFWVGGFV